MSICFSLFEDLWGQGRQSFIRHIFPQIWEHTPTHTPQMLISLGDVGCQSRELATWILPWLSLQPYIHSQAEPHWSSCEYYSAHRWKKRNIHIYVEYKNLSMKLSSLFCINVVGIGCILGKFLSNGAYSVWGPGTSKEVFFFNGNSHSWWNISNNLRLSSGQS